MAAAARRLELRGPVRRGLLGVLGGMGPAATADFYRKLVEATPALRDDEHIPLIVVGDPRIGDRSSAIESGQVEDVFSGMLQRLQYLEQAAVDAIAMPCNTAHFWLPRLREATPIPFLSLVQAAAETASRRAPAGGAALVLGTRATVASRIYEADLTACGLRLTMPTDAQQALVSRVIAAVKGGRMPQAAAEFEPELERWAEDADVILLACTELPLAAPEALAREPRLIDTTAALVDACVAWSSGFGRGGPSLEVPQP